MLRRALQWDLPRRPVVVFSVVDGLLVELAGVRLATACLLCGPGERGLYGPRFLLLAVQVLALEVLRQGFCNACSVRHGFSNACSLARP